MRKDHLKLEGLLDELEENATKEYNIMKKSFNRFEWELEKHLFTEEKAIFTEYSPSDISEGYKMLPVVKKHHKYMF